MSQIVFHMPEPVHASAKLVQHPAVLPQQVGESPAGINKRMKMLRKCLSCPVLPFLLLISPSFDKKECLCVRVCECIREIMTVRFDRRVLTFAKCQLYDNLMEFLHGWQLGKRRLKEFYFVAMSYLLISVFISGFQWRILVSHHGLNAVCDSIHHDKNKILRKKHCLVIFFAMNMVKNELWMFLNTIGVVCCFFFDRSWSSL